MVVVEVATLAFVSIFLLTWPQLWSAVSTGTRLGVGGVRWGVGGAERPCWATERVRELDDTKHMQMRSHAV